MMNVRLTKNQTNHIKDRLEERKYGQQITSMELAEKAGVSLDDVNRFERHLPIENPVILSRIASTLGITTELLDKIGSAEEISINELEQLDRCISESTSTGTTPSSCQRLGIRPIIH